MRLVIDLTGNYKHRKLMCHVGIPDNKMTDPIVKNIPLKFPAYTFIPSTKTNVNECVVAHYKFDGFSQMRPVKLE